jgi:hypothetical protein
MGENILTLFFFGITEPFEMKLSWNVPWIEPAKSLLFVLIRNQ